MAKQRKTANVKVKKKRWYPILASKGFNEQILGESFVSEPEKINGKFVSVNLSTITKSFKDQNINLTFKVGSVIDNKGHTELISYKILSSFIKRFVRRDKSKIADSFITKDKSGNLLRIKPLIITHNLATKSQKTEIRKAVKEFTKNYISKTTLDLFINELIRKDFQKRLKRVLKKTMPIRYAEIRQVGYNSVKLLSLKAEKIIDEEIVEEIKKVDEADEKIEDKVVEAKKEEVKKETPEIKVETKVVEESKTETPKVEIATEEPVSEVKEKAETPEIKEETKKA
jgi:ribosomal protein S3AE